MSTTAFNIGATAGKVIIDEWKTRDLGGTGREEILEHSWTVPRKCLVFVETEAYAPTSYTSTFLRNGQTVEPKRYHKYSYYSFAIGIFDAQKGDVIKVCTDRGRNYQGIYLYAISM